MPASPVDPARLNGQALARWYLRSPEEIEWQRQQAAMQQHRAYFGGPQSAQSDFDQSNRAVLDRRTSGLDDQNLGVSSRGDVDPGFRADFETSSRWPGMSAQEPSRVVEPVRLPSLFDRQMGTWPGPRTSRLQSMNQGSDGIPFNRATNRKLGTSSPIGRTNQTVGPVAIRPVMAAVKRQDLVEPIQPRSRQLGPSKTPVFQTGPDGKLQPVPGWHTTGPFDFGEWSHNIDWGGVSKDIGSIAGGALSFMEGGGFANTLIEGAGYKIGPDVVRGIVEGHHSWPKFMSGPNKQELARIHHSIHRMFHGDLSSALKQAGFPRIGGTGGSTDDWAKFFGANVDKRDEAIAILQRVTKEFDRKNGTKISKYLDQSLARGNAAKAAPSE